MARVRNWWSHSKTVVLIWLTSALLFYFGLQFVLRNSSLNYPSVPTMSDSERRSKLYDKMESDLNEHGAAFLEHGETSQSLSLSDLFTLKDGIVTPVLKAAKPPVRANVLYLSTEFSVPISEAVKSIFSPYFDKVIWFQNSSLYHFSMFHASHHITPVPAAEVEIEAEATAVEAVAKALCPLKIVLDRVLLTSTGVLLGCWQVASGTDPVTIRAKLRTALPRAPKNQLGRRGKPLKYTLGSRKRMMYDNAILHTSFARLLGPPKFSPTELHKASDQLQFFHELVARLNNIIRGFEADVSELWYVEEYDVLALALNGRMKVRRFKLTASKSETSEDHKVEGKA
ncbi:uncharacterized protein LOC117904842 isoform X2 [Vitis riparia]|uniref:uncharacterized protein LOC117904842 isoform X2 n=1 Tax=Vitis riparia TaxID=96939 RepID=UPI00155A3BFC|nr:uncharacterized protein LOC117904842 isoform X2 [Vitis riparia]